MHQAQLLVESCSFSIIRTLSSVCSPRPSGPTLRGRSLSMATCSSERNKESQKLELEPCQSMNTYTVPAKNPSLPTRRPPRVHPGQNPLLLLTSSRPLSIPWDCSSFFIPSVVPMRLWVVTVFNSTPSRVCDIGPILSKLFLNDLSPIKRPYFLSAFCTQGNRS